MILLPRSLSGLQQNVILTFSKFYYYIVENQLTIEHLFKKLFFRVFKKASKKVRPFNSALDPFQLTGVAIEKGLRTAGGSDESYKN